MRLAWCLVLLLPLASAQSLLEDPAGDVEVSVWENSQSAPGDWKPVDLRFLAIEEFSDELWFTVGIEGLPSCDGGQCPNAGDLRTYFQYGSEGYYVQQGIGPTGNAYGVLNSVTPGQIDGRAIGKQLGAVKDLAANAITAKVPRELIIDQSGAPPLQGAVLENLLTRSYSQFSLGGEDPAGSGSSDMLVTRDRMGLDAPASFLITQGGSETAGPIQISSPAPYRASNGGAALYRFDINITNLGGAESTFILRAEDLPPQWSFEAVPGGVTIPAGQNATTPVLIDSLSGHQHGGTSQFTVVVEDLNEPNTWGRLDLGVHYLSTPQPAGHHPTLWLHTLTDGPAATAASALGKDDGRIWMNALEEDPGDERVPVVAQGGVQGMGSQSAQWSICLIPNLRLGLDMDLDRSGTLSVRLGSTAPYLGVDVSGRLLHVGGPDDLAFCDPFFWRDRETTVIADVAASGPQDLINTVSTFEMTITPRAEGDFIEYQEGAQLILELDADYQGGAPGPAGLSMHPGGQMELPLLEYRDARPPGFVGGSAQETASDTNITQAPDAPVEKDSPAIGMLLPVVLAWCALRRR